MSRQWTNDEVRAAVSHFRNLALEERKALTYSATWFDYTFARWRCNGQVKRWVTRPDEIVIPAKHGLSTYGRFDEDDIMLVGPSELAQGLRKQVLSGLHLEVQRAVFARFPKQKVSHAQS